MPTAIDFLRNGLFPTTVGANTGFSYLPNFPALGGDWHIGAGDVALSSGANGVICHLNLVMNADYDGSGLSFDIRARQLPGGPGNASLLWQGVQWNAGDMEAFVQDGANPWAAAGQHSIVYHDAAFGGVTLSGITVPRQFSFTFPGGCEGGAYIPAIPWTDDAGNVLFPGDLISPAHHLEKCYLVDYHPEPPSPPDPGLFTPGGTTSGAVGYAGYLGANGDPINQPPPFGDAPGSISLGASGAWSLEFFAQTSGGSAIVEISAIGVSRGTPAHNIPSVPGFGLLLPLPNTPQTAPPFPPVAPIGGVGGRAQNPVPQPLPCIPCCASCCTCLTET